jgi:hypothetical protein
MSNYLRIGRVGVRINRKGIADWGYPLVRIGGLDLISRTSGGELTLASYHPRGSTTWYWSVVFCKRGTGPFLSRTPKDIRRGQWHDYYWRFRISRQDYHK